MGDSRGRVSAPNALCIFFFSVRQVGFEDPHSTAAGFARLSRCSRGTRGSLSLRATACSLARAGCVVLQVGTSVIIFPHSQIRG